MSCNIKLLHKTSKRARFYCESLKNEEYNTSSLIQYLESINGINKVRINKKIGSIVFEHDGSALNTIRDILLGLDVNKYKICDTFKGSCIDCIDESEPSLNGVIRASSVLVAERFISNDLAKFLLTTVAAKPLLVEGTKELFKEGLTSKVLEATAVSVSIARKDYLAANSTNAMLELGEYIEETTVHKSDDLIKELAKPNVTKAWVEFEENGKLTQKLINTSELKVGDIVIVGAGDTIAVDGHVLTGNASVNQVSMTGESEPVAKQRGDRVISGTVIEDGRLKIWAEYVGEDTATARIKNYIVSSLNEKSSIGLKATKLADKLVPVTLGLAGVSYLINKDFESVAAVLQADYSCALKLATPVAFKSSISKAGKDGIMIKGAKAIEALHSADTFVFDKTGTLTYGHLEVESINSFDEKWEEDDILNLTASAEEHYFHPVAEAVVKAAKEKGFVHMHHEEVEFIVAHGVKTIVNDKEVVIGSRHFLEDDEQIDFSNYEDKIEQCLLDGKTILYVGYDKKLLGTIGMRDKVRENAKDVLQKLKLSGVKNIVMLTGDIKEKAEALAFELGVDTVYANMRPTDKANIINKLKEQGSKIAFVGDGINDAPALMSADVGISMSKGADIAKATADIGLLKDDLVAIAEVKELANKTMKLIKYNFNATVGINSLILTGATIGLFTPITTAVLHNGTTIGLLFNSMKGVSIKNSIENSK
ncbi:heavy metal translocating P-type ATPase [Halarcobacter anaerophilus]|uniref:P-type Zn(2+) transporter n=1 Tax=Halarcobacter anaerophilus TaxID=877500 RepID=A0A4Q0XWP7_9BACT|nr:heavy metal translocating P-type ATPase [Halarcobacter anaerophilus]QDF28281.1 heavy metal translocating P-type ATPase [Halarcobacter anaerophilus]RXJ62050.1 heavy metal translocating P-type ATPase [Halarcobacter anaerophilus]